jgi:flagellar hook protein FlgE
MLRSLNISTTGIRQFQMGLDVIGNNLANINTVAFKAGRVDFADTLHETIRQPIGDGAGQSGASGIQFGNGVGVAAVKNSFVQGATSQTGVTTDLAIHGEGFFLVKNTVTGETLATRAGDFRMDSEGFLVNNEGFRVQGFNTSIGIDQSYPAGQAVGDIKIDKGLLPNGDTPEPGLKTFNIDNTGKIIVLLDDNQTQYVRGQIVLQNFQNPQALLKQGGNVYSGLDSGANPVGAGPSVPGRDGVGLLQSGHLELSNVDITREFANLITTQRAFQANARVLSTADEVLQEMVRLKR